jgi:hypothetical protein
VQVDYTKVVLGETRMGRKKEGRKEGRSGSLLA